MDTKDGKDGLRDILDKLETPAVRWALVFVGVVILVRLRLILFAAALPVMAYWHYSTHSEESSESAPESTNDGETMPPADEGDDDEFLRDDFDAPEKKRETKEVDPYDKSFWGEGRSESRSAPSRDKVDSEKKNASPFDDDDFGFSNLGGAAKSKPKDLSDPWDDDPSGGPVDALKTEAARKTSGDDMDFLGSLGSLGNSLGSLGGDDFGLGKSSMDFDFLGGGNGDDMDFLGGGFGGGKGKKGGGKGKKGKDGEKGDKGPREANPKQVFVAGVGDLPEDEIRMFFEDVGEVDRLKVLTTPEGESKGVCFVTFCTEEQAQQALGLHGSEIQGRRITVRLAHGGNKGEKGEGKGKDGGKDRDRRPPMGDREPRMEFGRSERFGDAFGDNDRGDRFGGDRPKGGGKGKGGGRGRNERSELDEALEEALADAEGPLKVADFDFAARRFLSELRSRDRSNDTQRFQEALDMVLKYTASKDRSSVRKWPAYVYTLLQKFDPQLCDQMRERDAERRQQKGGGGGFSRRPDEGGFSRRQDDD